MSGFEEMAVEAAGRHADPQGMMRANMARRIDALERALEAVATYDAGTAAGIAAVREIQEAAVMGLRRAAAIEMELCGKGGA